MRVCKVGVDVSLSWMAANRAVEAASPDGLGWCNRKVERSWSACWVGTTDWHDPHLLQTTLVECCCALQGPDFAYQLVY